MHQPWAAFRSAFLFAKKTRQVWKVSPGSCWLEGLPTLHRYIPVVSHSRWSQPGALPAHNTRLRKTPFPLSSRNRHRLEPTENMAAPPACHYSNATALSKEENSPTHPPECYIQTSLKHSRTMCAFHQEVHGYYC